MAFLCSPRIEYLMKGDVDQSSYGCVRVRIGAHSEVQQQAVTLEGEGWVE